MDCPGLRPHIPARGALAAALIALIALSACSTPTPTAAPPAVPTAPPPVVAATPPAVSTAAPTRPATAVPAATAAPTVVVRATPAAAQMVDCATLLKPEDVQGVLGGTAGLQPTSAAVSAAVASTRPELRGSCLWTVRGTTARGVTLVLSSLSVARANNPNYDPLQLGAGSATTATSTIVDVPGLGDTSKWFMSSATPGTGLLITYRGDFGLILSVVNGRQEDAVALMRLVLAKLP